jgi:hypothetical protein
MRATTALSLAIIGATWACGSSGPKPAPGPEQRTLNVVLRPVRGRGDNVTDLSVRWELRGHAPNAQRFSIRAPIVYASVAGIADSIQDLAVHDAKGVVPLQREDDPVNPAGFPYFRHWRAERDVVPPVIATYRARPRATAASGPQFALQAYGGGVSTAGSGFFALPEDSGIVYRTRLHWDLAELGENSIAASTFGDGDLELVGPPEQLLQGYYMAGRLGRLPVRGALHGFSAYWLGTPPFDAKREMQWTAQMYSYLRTFFRDTTDDPFRVFVRVLPGQNGYPGTALLNSFMLGTPVRSGDSVRSAPRETLTHEMVHHWAVGIDGPEGTVTWFPEGLATYYARLLPMKAGLDSVASFAQSVSNTARAYYTSPARNLPADSIGRAGFGDPSARNLPYARGSLYFADLDAQLRAASGGHRKLEDIVFPIFDRIRRGERVTQDDFVAAIVRELGPSARAQFEAVMVRGETLVPAANAFGPCFDRTATKFTVDGKSIAGYDWIRLAWVPDAQCRAW